MGNTTGLRTLDAIGDDERVEEVLRDRNPAGVSRWQYTVLLVSGWQIDSDHFTDGDTAAIVRDNFKRIAPCTCGECLLEASR